MSSQNQPILLNPGPTNVSETVRAALCRGDACHREVEISDLVAGIRRQLLELFDPSEAFDVSLLTGSGTAALEAAVIASCSKNGTLLVLENGIYGDRMAAIARAHGMKVESIKADWFSRHDLDQVEARILANPEIETLGLVHHETTTGLLNDVEAVGKLAKRHGRRLVLDTVSGLAGDRLELDAWGVDIAACTANKCLGGLPGISMVFLRKSQRATVATHPRRSYYFDIIRDLEAQDKSCGAFTPAVQILWALEVALKELRAESVGGRISRFASVAGRLRRGFAEMGLQLRLPASLRSNTITSLALPQGHSFESLHDSLKTRGFIVYAGQGQLRETLFRVANMGQVSDSEYDRFLQELKALLS